MDPIRGISPSSASSLARVSAPAELGRPVPHHDERPAGASSPPATSDDVRNTAAEIQHVAREAAMGAMQTGPQLRPLASQVLAVIGGEHVRLISRAEMLAALAGGIAVNPRGR